MRTVLVTGASSGIGRTICETLAQRGDHVIGMARDFSKFPNVATHLVGHYAIDLADHKALQPQVRILTAAHPDIDAVICNAGYGRFGHLEQFSFQQITRLMDVNFTSHACLVRACLPLMRTKERSNFIFMGSEAALRGTQQGAVYCASKFAMRGFAQALREECAAANIGVTMINPGMVRTPFYDAQDFAPGAAPENYSLPEDVAAMVCSVLDMRPGTALDEISMSPQKRVIQFRRHDSGGKNEADGDGDE